MISSKSVLPVLLLCNLASAQLLHPSPSMPSFGVVSVHRTDPNQQLSHGGTNPDSYRAVRVTIKETLAYAFGLGYDDELVNGPSWIKNDHFDIQGKLDDDQVASLRKMSRDDREEQMRLMAQSMLLDRFHLAYHFETRNLPVYDLEIDKGGLKCHRDSTSQPAISDPSRPRFRWSAAPAPPPPPPGWQPPSPSEQKTLQQSMHLRTKGWPFWLTTALLGHQPELQGRPLIDKTGLEGPYDCEMDWSAINSDGAGQSFFSAVKDQLGLRLKPSKGPVEVLVIDSIERPSEN